jgi:hypothetical protein
VVITAHGSWVAYRIVLVNDAVAGWILAAHHGVLHLLEPLMRLADEAGAQRALARP